ncbi:MAG: hypothetical protein AAFP03_07325 [Cyanobacteria bacterium J06598_3]
MTSPYPGKTKGQNIFLLVSMAGWLIVGASLIYLMPVAANLIAHSATTETWMETLGRGGYKPAMAEIGGSIAFVLTVTGNLLWYRKQKNAQPKR